MPGTHADALEPPPSPRRSMEDSGAHDLDSSDDHFSDAQSGVQSGRTSPVPVTRVERIDDELAHGEIPGTDAFDKRRGDATPDEIITPTSRRGSAMSLSVSRPSTPGGQPIPTTVVEKIDPTSASHGEVPGTDAHAMRTADAVPDLVVKVEGQDHISPSVGRSRAGSTPGDLPIPTTRLERVDASPSHGEVPGTAAYEMRKGDAAPDEVEEVGDAPGKRSHSESSSKDLTGSGSPTLENNRSTSLDSEFAPIEASTETEVLAEYNEADDAEDAADGDKEDKEEADGGFGDDFDDFEEGDEDAEFGDFDDGFQEPEAVTTPTQSIPTSIPTLAPSFPVLDFDELDSTEDIHKASQPYLDALYPPDEIDQSALSPTSTENPIFLTQRSASLWSQLVAPPPLQPPNWIRSRIRRLFLVSLGVPVDLDEILPASKQKKLILPSIHLGAPGTSPRTSSESRNVSRLKQSDGNTSSTSVDSEGKPSKRRRGPPPPPELDLVSARQLCTITDEAMEGLTMEELQEHTQKLEAIKGLAEEALDYWTKRTDEKLGDREAFEGVIENLVKHARKVRK